MKNSSFDQMNVGTIFFSFLCIAFLFFRLSPPKDIFRQERNTFILLSPRGVARCMESVK